MLICRIISGKSAVHGLLSLRWFPSAFLFLCRRELVVATFDCYLASFGYVPASWAALNIFSRSGWLFSGLLKFHHLNLSPTNKLLLDNKVYVCRAKVFPCRYEVQIATCKGMCSDSRKKEP